jgi:hypothetical protein
MAREYFTRLVASYGQKLEWNKPFESKGGGPATGGAYSIEPHVAERVFGEMVREAKVPVHFKERLVSVKKDGARIAELVTEDGTVFRAKMFIDATYEGDLMAKAGVSYTLLREGNAKYGETYNGIHYSEKYLPRTNHLKPGPTGRVKGGQGVWDRDFPLDPYVVAGDPKSGLLPLVQSGEPGMPGEPAPGVQAYCFRLCLTTKDDLLPYIREARRMVSGLVLTEHHTFGRSVAPNSVGLGSYGTDTHEIRRIVKITDGAIRDLDEMTNAGFKALARRLCVGHAFSCPARWNCEVEVFGRKVQPGQLIHADKHGFLAIPAEDEARLLEAARFMDANECETVIPAARDTARRTTPEILAAINDAGRRFGENARAKFGRKGEW